MMTFRKIRDTESSNDNILSVSKFYIMNIFIKITLPRNEYWEAMNAQISSNLNLVKVVPKI